MNVRVKATGAEIKSLLCNTVLAFNTYSYVSVLRILGFTSSIFSELL